MGRHGLHAVHPRAWEQHYVLPVKGVRSARQMTNLISCLQGEADANRRLQHLLYDIRRSPQLFSGDQLITIAACFPDNLILALHLLDHHLLGVTCAQARSIMVSLGTSSTASATIATPERQLEGLKILAEHMLDSVNRMTLLQMLPNIRVLRIQGQQILEAVRGSSHTYGRIKNKRVIFLIDTSGSMRTRFRTTCGETFNRLEYVVHDLHKILHHRVDPGFKFNIIHFASDAVKWHSSLQTATPNNLKKAEHYLDHLEAEGGTNTHDALRAAIANEEAEAIYLLSDGEPTHGITNIDAIIGDTQQWLSMRRSPIKIHTVAFLMGHTIDDPRPRRLMATLASISGGVFRCIDPQAPEDEEHCAFFEDNNDESFDADPKFQSYFNARMAAIPPSALAYAGPTFRMPSSSNPSFGIPLSDRPNFGVNTQLRSASASVPNFGLVQPSSRPVFGTTSGSYRNLGTQANPTFSYAASGATDIVEAPQIPDWKMALKMRARHAEDEISVPTLYNYITEGEIHHMYQVQIVLKNAIPDRDITWTLGKNYNDFKAFHSVFRWTRNNAGLKDQIPFPPSPFFGTRNDAFYENRRRLLEIYLRSIYARFHPLDYRFLDTFLLFDLNVSEAIREAEDRLKAQAISQSFIESPDGVNPAQTVNAYPQGTVFPPQQGGTLGPQGGAYTAPQGAAYPQQNGGAYMQQGPQSGAYLPQNTQGSSYTSPQSSTYMSPQNNTYMSPQSNTYMSPQSNTYMSPQNQQSLPTPLGLNSPQTDAYNGANLPQQSSSTQGAPPSQNAANPQQEKTEDAQCVICFAEKKQVALIPCGHALFCKACVSDLLNSRGVCPICNAEVTDTLLVFF